MNNEWLKPYAIVPVDISTTGILIAEIKRLNTMENKITDLSDFKLLNVEDLSKIIKKSVRTIQADCSRNPECLPPRFRIPKTNAILWLEKDVIDWLNSGRNQ